MTQISHFRIDDEFCFAYDIDQMRQSIALPDANSQYQSTARKKVFGA